MGADHPGSVWVRTYLRVLGPIPLDRAGRAVYKIAGRPLLRAESRRLVLKFNPVWLYCVWRDVGPIIPA